MQKEKKNDCYHLAQVRVKQKVFVLTFTLVRLSDYSMRDRAKFLSKLSHCSLQCQSCDGLSELLFELKICSFDMELSEDCASLHKVEFLNHLLSWAQL